MKNSLCKNFKISFKWNFSVKKMLFKIYDLIKYIREKRQTLFRSKLFIKDWWTKLIRIFLIVGEMWDTWSPKETRSPLLILHFFIIFLLFFVLSGGRHTQRGNKPNGNALYTTKIVIRLILIFSYCWLDFLVSELFYYAT